MKVKDNYPDGVCPDCGEKIPDNAVSGESCRNCGHVFYLDEIFERLHERVKENMRKEEEERFGADLMANMVLFGGHKVGFNTNPETERRQCFIEIGKEKIVCLAQGGECRYNSDYYSPGLNDRKSWTTPIIDWSCPDQCCYKVLVCDGHDEKCEGSITYYPQYNKFNGQFSRYCRNLEKFLGKEEEREKKIKKGMKIVKKKMHDNIEGWYYRRI